MEVEIRRCEVKVWWWWAGERTADTEILVGPPGDSSSLHGGLFQINVLGPCHAAAAAVAAVTKKAKSIYWCRS